MNAKKVIPILSLVVLVVTFGGGWWLLKQQDSAYEAKHKLVNISNSKRAIETNKDADLETKRSELMSKLKQQRLKKPPKLSASFKLGPVNRCQRAPLFTNVIDLKQPIALDTEQSETRGVSFVEARRGGKRYQHPSWDDVGHVGSTVRDQSGNIYVLPVPIVSLEHNDPKNRNTIYKIDSLSQEMAEYLALGLSKEATRLPFGVVGSAVDCDTNSLYVSSVEGSQAFVEQGVTYQINLASKQIVSRMEGKDLFGLDVLNTASGKRLYYGLARKPHIYSVALDAAGHFSADHRYELSLAELPQGDTATPVKIRFSRVGGETLMTVQKGVFDFRPSAANEKGRVKYVFKLMADQSWLFDGRQ